MPVLVLQASQSSYSVLRCEAALEADAVNVLAPLQQRNLTQTATGSLRHCSHSQVGMEDVRAVPVVVAVCAGSGHIDAAVAGTTLACWQVHLARTLATTARHLRCAFGTSVLCTL